MQTQIKKQVLKHALIGLFVVEAALIFSTTLINIG